ncbi:MAG: hypothetical protein NZ585_05215 [Chloracidobacterium sp.]|nr:hypothetical protein [Chloracidobacterium sp.]MDW8216906.1 glycosyltransferase family 9 protein [Acidobacteriota bacterium]
MESLLFVHSGTAVEFLLCLPAIQATRWRFPEARLWLAAPNFACDLAQLADCVDAVHPLGAHRSMLAGPSLFRALHALTVLRQQTFDAVIGLTDAIPEQIGMLLIQARRRLTLRMRSGRDNQHLTDAAAALVAELGVTPTPPMPRLVLPPAVQQAERQKLVKLGWRETGLTFVLHPTVGFAPQVWPAEQFAPLAARLVAEYDAQVLVVETEEEPGLTDRLRGEWKRYKLKPVVLRRPRAALLAVALAQASVVVGSNRAPVHVAVAVQTPAVVALEGPQEASRLAPRGPRNRLLYAQPGRPVSLDDVFDAVCQVITASRTGALFGSDGGG